MIEIRILQQTIAPSMGQETQIFSSDGRLRNCGAEASLNISPVVNRNMKRLLENDALELEPGPLPGTLRRRARHGGGFIEPARSSATRLRRAPRSAVTPAWRDFQMSFSSDVDFHRFTLGFCRLQAGR